jgi:RsiW-degrading membrane proteinase PrsW (M82 family)/pSer/pThr/pTyr-binding forkhead associated (FHA) protein
LKLRLVIESGSLAGQQFELEEGSIQLGRSAESQIRFDFHGDPGVSSKHAVITAQDHNFRLIDERSTNGTLINGTATRDGFLNDGDVIRLGPNGPQIRVVIETDQPAEQKTVIFKLPEPPPVPPPIPQPEIPQQQIPPPPPLQPPASGFSLQNFMQTREGRRTLMGCAVTVTVCGFLLLIVMAMMIQQMGFFPTFVGTVVAFIPAPLYLLALLLIDRFDPEPGTAIAASFAWGSLVAILVSMVLNTTFGMAMGQIAGERQGDALTTIISAPIFEEGSKGIFVVLLLIFLRKEFDGIVDGIFYASVIALGFATFENILYYGRQFSEYGISGLAQNFFTRGILAPFSHALFTSMTGLGCGISRETHNKTLKMLAPPAGYVGAMILHGFWNAIATATRGVGYYIAYVMVWVPLFIIFVCGVIAVVRREQKIIKRMLAPQVDQGVITQDQYNIATSLRMRMSWIFSSLSNVRVMNARRRFLRFLTKLAFGYWHMELAAKENGSTISSQLVAEYQNEVRRLQPLV